jgi:hypothetical protein
VHGRFREFGNREINGRGSVDDGLHDRWRGKGEWCKQTNVTFAFAFLGEADFAQAMTHVRFCPNELATPIKPIAAAACANSVDNKLFDMVRAVPDRGPAHFAEVKFEQKEIGIPEYGCDLPLIDVVAFAKACGADAFRCERPDEVRAAIRAALNSSKAARSRSSEQHPAVWIEAKFRPIACDASLNDDG